MESESGKLGEMDCFVLQALVLNSYEVGLKSNIFLKGPSCSGLMRKQYQSEASPLRSSPGRSGKGSPTGKRMENKVGRQGPGGLV